jgi:hypothetical protein
MVASVPGDCAFILGWISDFFVVFFTAQVIIKYTNKTMELLVRHY